MAPKTEDMQAEPIRQRLALTPIPNPLNQEKFVAMLTSEIREVVRAALVALLEEEVTARVIMPLRHQRQDSSAPILHNS